MHSRKAFDSSEGVRASDLGPSENQAILIVTFKGSIILVNFSNLYSVFHTIL